MEFHTLFRDIVDDTDKEKLDTKDAIAAAGSVDVAMLNLLYQPAKSWVMHAVQSAYRALHTGGRFYVLGAKDRGILSTARTIQERFGNLETVEIHKGQRLICARKLPGESGEALRNRIGSASEAVPAPLSIFANSQLDEGTQLLLDALKVHLDEVALDLGCGAGYIGLHIARLAPRGMVTMVDVSLAAVDAAKQAAIESGLPNVRVLPSDGAQEVIAQRFSLVATNPPFHQGGIQTPSIAERFIRETARILQSGGRFYLVANRFLKYEVVLRDYFASCEEVAGNSRFKVLRCYAR
jgi:16S rRNA (guanine1207-N2)-methyltransferase